MPVEHVVLEDEEEVIENRHDGQGQFDDVEPIVDGQAPTDQGKDASKKVHKDVEDRPAFRAFPLAVPISGRGIFDEGYENLDIPHEDQGVPIQVGWEDLDELI